MGIFNRIRGQFRSVIEWTGVGPDDLFSKWSDSGDEIKDASKLIVGPGQGCIFVYEGRIESVITDEGITDIETANVPFWTTLSRAMQGFTSEHKVGIYFFRKTKILDQKWGTPSAVKYEDPKYKFPVGLKAFGNYSFRIAEPEALFTAVIGSNSSLKTTDFRTMMTARLVEPLTDFLAESKYSYADIDANREEISAAVAAKLQAEFKKLGFEIIDFKIEGTSFDEDTMRRINRIADMSAESQAASIAGLSYAQLQQVEAMKAAASNQGGAAGVGMGMGAGLGFGQMMAGAMNPAQAEKKADPMEKLASLKKMLDGGLITQAEYDQKKKEILSSM
jgi:membrane protease subunit (stomatin/prohibitin family)